MSFSTILRELRELNGYTQKDLAKMLHLSKNAISHYEKGINMPNIETLTKIADIFGTSVDYLIGRTNIKIDYNKLTSQFTRSTTLDKIIDVLASLDSEHRKAVLEMLDYAKCHNEVLKEGKKQKK